MDTNWFTCPQPNPQAAYRLFCFAHAGGSAAMFRDWPTRLSAAELWVVNLPGRGARFTETVYTELTPLVQALAGAFEPQAHGRYAFFGHSMGARLAFELARALRRKALPQPGLLHIAACPAPQLPAANPPIYNLPRPALVAELQRRNGMPPELAAHQEILDLFLPIVRADMQLYETAVYTPERPLTLPLALYGGRRDPLTTEPQLTAWRKQTTAACSESWFDGDHFFVNSQMAAVVSAVGNASDYFFGSRP